MKNILKTIIPIAFGFVLSTSFANASQFSDLAEDYWAYPQINQLAKEGIVVGYPDGTYRPDEKITRAEFASMTVKALHQENAEITDTIAFDDVPKNHWAWDSVQRAVRFDLISETENNLFRPNEDVTRAECLEIVVNSLTTEEITLEEARATLAKKYSDINAIPEWFLIKAGKAEVLGIIVPNPNQKDYMAANQAATRAEVAAFLYNMIEQVKLAPNKKLAEVMKPVVADGVVIDNAIVRGTVGIIPAGTTIPVTVQDDLNSQSSVVGSPFEVKVTENLVTPEKYLLIQEGASIKGLLIGSKKAMLIIRNGKLVLNSKEIKTRTEQVAKLNGFNETNPNLSIWRKIFKGNKVKYTNGETIDLELLKTLKIDLTNGWILD